MEKVRSTAASTAARRVIGAALRHERLTLLDAGGSDDEERAARRFEQRTYRNYLTIYLLIHLLLEIKFILFSLIS